MSDPSHHSKSVLNAAFELSPDNIAVLDHSGRVIDANPALLRYLGATREQLRNGDASSLATHLDLSKVSKAIADAVTQARRFDLELPTTAIDGTIGVQVVNIVPEKNESGGVERVVIYGREFADIGRLKELVASAQDQLHAAIKVLPDIFWIKDLDGRYVLCNDQFDRFNQVAPGSLLGRKTLDLDPHAQIALQIETDRQALASEGVVRFQFEVEPRDGDCRRYYEVKKIAIRDPQGVATGLLGIARDITATQVLEQELKDREREFRQLAENLPDMLVRYDSNAVPIFANDALKEFFKTRLGLSPQGTDTDAIPVEAGLSPVRGIRERVRSVIADGEQTQRAPSKPGPERSSVESKRYCGQVSAWRRSPHACARRIASIASAPETWTIGIGTSTSSEKAMARWVASRSTTFGRETAWKIGAVSPRASNRSVSQAMQSASKADRRPRTMNRRSTVVSRLSGSDTIIAEAGSARSGRPNTNDLAIRVSTAAAPGMRAISSPSDVGARVRSVKLWHSLWHSL